MDAMEANDPVNNSISIVALSISNENIAFCVYQELFNNITVDQIKVSGLCLAEIIGHVKFTYSPSLFLIKPNVVSNTQLLDLLQAPLDSSSNIPIEYDIPKSSLWSRENAVELLTTKFTIKSWNRDSRSYADPKQTYKKIESLIDIQSVEISQALGALLSHLKSRVFILDTGNIISLSSLKHSTSFEKYMRIDEQTFKSLQILVEDKHPNVAKENQRGKEGFSLFSILDRTKSLAGRTKLKGWMLKPLYDKDMIMERQNSIEILMKNMQFVRDCEKKMRHISIIPKLILRIKKVESTDNDYCRLISSIENGVSILQLMIQFVNDEDKTFGEKLFFSKLVEDVDIKALQNLSYFLTATFDFKRNNNLEGDDTGSGGTQLFIKEGVDSKLDELRYQYEMLDQYLIDAAHKILDSTPLLNTVRVEYIPQLGYLVLVQQDDVHFVDNDETFLFVFAESCSYYYKHPVVDDLDNKFGDIKSMISDYQKGIMLQIEENLLDHEYLLQLFSDMLSTLDALISMSVISQEKKFIKPEIVEDNIIIIKNGRHPLQELTVESFVPNDTYISEERSVSLITGPNSSGKSVYIKQVGIIVYLSHIGCFVPAEQAVIGLTDRIMTRISSIETVSTPQSAFSLDLCQVSRMLTYSSTRSLILIDEFGKGTAPIDGISVLAATIRHVAQKRLKAMLTLHFYEIFNKDILTDISNIYTFRMDIYKGNENSDDEGDQMPLYKLRVGLEPDSYGLRCARIYNLPDEVVRRALVIKTAINERKLLPPRVAFGASKGLHNSNNQELLKAFFASNWSDSSTRHTSLQNLQTLKMKLL